jgi:HlyD family secretion protein
VRKIWLVLLLAPVIGLIAYFSMRRATPSVVAFAKTRRETLVSMLPTNGKVEPLDWQSIRVENPGLAVKIPVHEGQDIRRGALLAQIGAPGMVGELRAAEARQAEASSQLQGLQGGGRSADLSEITSNVERTRYQRDEALREYNSLKRLVAQQAATNFELETANQKVKTAELQLQALESRRKTLVGASDLSAAQAHLQEAAANSQVAREHAAQNRIYSPLNGTVYSLPARVGTYLNAGDLIANVGMLDRLRVRVYVDEPELGRVQVGQLVRITWDALPGREWQGAVERKPTEVMPLGTRQVGEVLCTIENPERLLVPGTNINAEIRTSVTEHALTIPKIAIRRDSQGFWVFRLNDGRIERQNIQPGPSNVTRASVLRGLADGDAVALPTDQPLKAGDKVTPAYQ